MYFISKYYVFIELQRSKHFFTKKKKIKNYDHDHNIILFLKIWICQKHTNCKYKTENRHETPVLEHPIKIIHIDNDLVVLDKPCSMPVSSWCVCNLHQQSEIVTKKKWKKALHCSGIQWTNNNKINKFCWLLPLKQNINPCPVPSLP